MTLSKWGIGFLAIGIAFVVWESAGAIVGGPGPQTLSEYVWILFSFKFGWLVLAAGLGYLTWHLARGAWKKGQR